MIDKKVINDLEKELLHSGSPFKVTYSPVPVEGTISKLFNQLVWSGNKCDCGE